MFYAMTIAQWYEYAVIFFHWFLWFCFVGFFGFIFQPYTIKSAPDRKIEVLAEISHELCCCCFSKKTEACKVKFQLKKQKCEGFPFPFIINFMN